MQGGHAVRGCLALRIPVFPLGLALRGGLVLPLMLFPPGLTVREGRVLCLFGRNPRFVLLVVLFLFGIEVSFNHFCEVFVVWLCTVVDLGQIVNFVRVTELPAVLDLFVE
mgnify:CR=1 FL=1